MHRRLQLGMRENPASNRRHDSRFVLREGESLTAGTHVTHAGKTLFATERSHVESTTTEASETREGREVVGNFAGIVNSGNSPRQTPARAEVNPQSDGKARHIESDREFEPLLDVAEAARLLRMHPRTLRTKARERLIPAVQVGRRWRFRASTLNDWLCKLAR
jgi:excisionase family DNA binding protein